MNILKGFFCNFYLYIAGNKQQTEHADATRHVFGRPNRSLNDPTIKSRKSEVAKIRQLLYESVTKKIILVL